MKTFLIAASALHNVLFSFFLPGPGDDGVGGEDPHAVERRLRLVGRGELAPDHAELLQGPRGTHL